MRALPTIVCLTLVVALGPTTAWAQSTSDDTSSPEATTEDDPTEPEPEPEPNVDPFDEFDHLSDEAPGEPNRASERPLELMSRDELEKAGFEFGSETAGPDTSAALLLAATAGTAVHGIGHFYLGDRRMGWFLVGMEGVSVGLMLSSAVFFGLTEAASPWASLFAPALQAGLAGFVFSYLVDVIGTVQHGESKLPENTAGERGVGFRARYGLFSASGLPIRHVIDGQLAVDVGGVYGSASTTQDVFLDLASYRGRLGVRALRGAQRLSFLAAEAHGDYLQWKGDGEFGRIGADGRLRASYELGEGFPHVSEFALGLMGGLGNHWVQIAPRGSTTFGLATSRLYVPFDVWASLNVSQNLNVQGGYGSPDLDFIAPIHRLLGVAHVEFTYRSSSYGDISLRAEIGDGFALWLGGGLWFGR